MKKEMQSTTTVINGFMKKLPKSVVKGERASDYNKFLKKTLSKLLEFDNTISKKKEKKKEKKSHSKKRKYNEKEDDDEKPTQKKRKVNDKREWICDPGCLKKFAGRRNLRIHQIGETTCKKRELHGMTSQLFNERNPPNMLHQQGVIKNALVKSSSGDSDSDEDESSDSSCSSTSSTSSDSSSGSDIFNV